MSDDNLIKSIKSRRVAGGGTELSIEFKDNQTPEEVEAIRELLFGITDEVGELD